MVTLFPNTKFTCMVQFTTLPDHENYKKKTYLIIVLLTTLKQYPWWSTFLQVTIKQIKFYYFTSMDLFILWTINTSEI